MSEINVRFAILTKQLDADSFWYCKDIRSISSLEEADELLAGRFSDLMGGYVFIIDQQIWNSYDHASFDSGHIRFAVDSLAFSALLLNDLAVQINERPMISCVFTEMSSLQIEFISTDDVTITGINADDKMIYPSKIINFKHLLREIIVATEDFLSVSTEAIDRRAALASTDNPSDLEQVNRVFLDDFRNTLELLRQHA